VQAVPRLCEFYPGICLTTTEKKARENLSHGKKNLSQVKKVLRVQYTYYQNTHPLQNPQIYTHTHTQTHTHTYTHTNTHTHKHTHARTHAHTHTHTHTHTGSYKLV
jgi:ABC-type Zn2+ transport system substrate-binding protein/surface adhesin